MASASSSSSVVVSQQSSSLQDFNHSSFHRRHRHIRLQRHAPPAPRRAAPRTWANARAHPRHPRHHRRSCSTSVLLRSGPVRDEYSTLLPAAALSRAGLHAAGSGFPLRARAPLLQHARAAVVLKARLLGVLLPADAQMLAAACIDVRVCGPRAASSLVRRLAASAAACFGAVPLTCARALRFRRRGRARRPSCASLGRRVPSRRSRCARRRVGPAPAALVRLLQP